MLKMRCLSWPLSFVFMFMAMADSLNGQPADHRKLEAAYHWSRDKFEKEGLQIEQDFEAEIRAAKMKRAEAIKMARIRYNQGLEFLNVNPGLPQSLREIIDEVM